MADSSKGRLFIISGPSGVGKGTLVKEVLDRAKRTSVSISATTRSPREGEIDGQSYYFLDVPEFEAMIASGGLLEWASYQGNYYGTPLKPVLDKLEEGQNVILEIEVQGASKVKQIMPEAVSVFIEPPSIEELERRLRGRGTEDDASIASRLDTAKLELQQKMGYDIQLTNNDLESCALDLMDIIEGCN